jgi:hypothetical protein
MAREIFLHHAALMGALEVRVPRLNDWPLNSFAFLAFWEATTGQQQNNCGDTGHEFFNLDLDCSSLICPLVCVCVPSTGDSYIQGDIPFLPQQEHL